MKAPYIPLAVTAVVVALTVLVMRPSARKPFKGDPAKVKYMSCPVCDREWSYRAELYEAGCTRCGGPLDATVESVKVSGRGASTSSKLFALILVELTVGMAVAVYIASRKPAEEEIEYFYLQCAKCKQRIRYQERQIGHAGACRRCKRPFIFPEPAPTPTEEESRPTAEA